MNNGSRDIEWRNNEPFVYIILRHSSCKCFGFSHVVRFFPLTNDIKANLKGPSSQRSLYFKKGIISQYLKKMIFVYHHYALRFICQTFLYTIQWFISVFLFYLFHNHILLINIYKFFLFCCSFFQDGPSWLSITFNSTSNWSSFNE
jgi:hypothetical protein